MGLAREVEAIAHMRSNIKYPFCKEPISIWSCLIWIKAEYMIELGELACRRRRSIFICLNYMQAANFGSLNFAASNQYKTFLGSRSQSFLEDRQWQNETTIQEKICRNL